MAKNLLIVESPAKARTIGKYLGRDFKIMASVGHVKDLPKNRLGVDIKNDFKPEYVVIKGKGKILKEIKKEGKNSDAIYLAPDPDREGEAIAWHIAEELKNASGRIHRVLFNEITPRGIKEGLSAPRELDSFKYESQQARRILDRLVGYQISPLLWAKVKKGLSAGRVQSVALRMICEREKEIFSFTPSEYWSITAHLKSDTPPPFKARLIKFDSKKIELKTEKETKEILENIKSKRFVVQDIRVKQRTKSPSPPFITSTLQQEAYKRLGFSAKKTMTIAQNLYEGVEIGSEGLIGLITYMRTDSFRVSDDASNEAREFIEAQYGKEYLPQRSRRFKSPKTAQEAHEAIRPTSAFRTPENLQQYLTKDQYLLYTLIWKRFIASQMADAILQNTMVDISAGKAIFRATGTVVVFNGFTTLYDIEEAKKKDNDKRGDILPPSLKKNSVLELIKLEPKQHFTQPPPRYTEATLIKALEENGIGRPSTYATILGNIRQRDYVRLEKGRFRPTELGFLVTELLVENFPDILNVDFTAHMEESLDMIESGKRKWVDVLREFYSSFEKEIEKAKKEMKGEIETGLKCPECGNHLKIRAGKNGLFLGCSNFPDCKYTSNFTRDEKGNIIIEEKETSSQEKCEICGRDMVIKRGKFGPFLACTGFPECKNTRPLKTRESNNEINIQCPEKGCDGMIVPRKTKKGRLFYACNRYPECKFAMWYMPVDNSCPKCGTRVMGIKNSSKQGPILVCRNKECDFKQAFDPS